MRSSIVRRLILVGVILALPVVGHAQEATVSGTVTDVTGGVLPGVTVQAVHEASGNTFEAVTDEHGAYRIPARIGVYRLTAQLQGFVAITRSGLELLVGQQAVVNLQMTLSAVQESVTVTGEAPLVDITSSTLGGNVDSRQMQELPVNGRNWVDLAMLAPGSRINAVGSAPIARDNRGDFQLNVDGQQVTMILSGSSHGQPRYSRDAIAEFEYISNRFDATQGRSMGMQVNAVTKSGTNIPSGTVSGYFRDDRFNAADFITGRVLPYSNQQVSTTFGGPIRKDRLHVFGNYEYQREPQTFTYTTPFPIFNLNLTGSSREDHVGVRLDYQVSPQTRFTARGNLWSHHLPYDPRQTGGSNRTPSSATSNDRNMKQVFASLTRVVGNRAMYEVKGGYSYFGFVQDSYIKNPTSPAGTGTGGPQVRLRGLTVGMTQNNTPQDIYQAAYQVRNDFTYSFTKGGRHTLKLGGEYIHDVAWLDWCANCIGILDAQGGPIPANIEDLFPDFFDSTTWNLAPLSRITRFWAQSIAKTTIARAPRHQYAAWLQDDWAIMPRLTLNLGLRYDLYTNTFAEGVSLPPFLDAGRPLDKLNFGPRLGFAFSLTDRTVIRGGFGKYYAEVTSRPTFWSIAWSQNVQAQVPNDGRPDFAVNPFNGPTPSYDGALRLVQELGQQRSITSQLADPNSQFPYSYQTSIGVQRQLGVTMAVEADYVFTGARHELIEQNINRSYNPATGLNYPFTDRSRLPYPDWGIVNMARTVGRSNYHALQTAFRKRFSQRWQATATYLLSGLWDDDPQPSSGLEPVPFPVAPDLGGEYSLAETDQRHRAVLNAIWETGYGLQLSGLYHFGSGERFTNTYGGDLRACGAGCTRLRPDGTIVPRNSFVGDPIHRVDLRIQRRFRFGRRAAVDGILEVFNLFNHANYGAYTLQEINARYGKPVQNINVAYQPRILQLGFRFAF